MKTIIVAGITRSGLTLTMQMLYKGGYACFGEYPAFENYEIGDISWNDCKGKAVKLVDTQLQFPPTGEYHVIRLRRNYEQQAKSMCKMISTFMDIKLTSSDRKRMQNSLSSDYAKIDAWMQRQKSFIIIDFEDLILKPREMAEKIKIFTDADLDLDKMVSCVISRSTDCFPTMLESKFI